MSVGLGPLQHRQDAEQPRGPDPPLDAALPKGALRLTLTLTLILALTGPAAFRCRSPSPPGCPSLPTVLKYQDFVPASCLDAPRRGWTPVNALTPLIHLGCFQFGLIMNRHAVDIYIQVFAWK